MFYDLPGPQERPFEGYARVVLGVVGSFLETSCGHLSAKVDKFPIVDFWLRFEGPFVVLRQS